MIDNNDDASNHVTSRQRIGKTLQKVFGTEFTVEASSDTAAACGRSDFADQTESNNRVVISPIRDYQWNVVISDLVDSEQTFSAFGEVDALNRETIVRLVDCVRDSLAQQESERHLSEQVECFTKQVTEDLEEACWFRAMAEQVAECRADDPLRLLCARILPHLRELLHSRSVVVFEETGEFSAPMLIAHDSETEKPHVSADVVHSLVKTFGDSKSVAAVVRNQSFCRETVDAHRDLVSQVGEFVLVRIGTQSQHFGWLVALSRNHAVDDPSMSRAGEVEFGTHEATLMETAAVLLATHASNRELFAEQEQTLIGIVTAMVNALDARDPYTRGHSQRVAQVGQRIGAHLGLTTEECEDIYLSGLLHDIGKIGVADDVLLKNGPLDPEERRQIEQHTVIGHSILSPVMKLSHVLPGVMHHHERYDGDGYPSRLKGESIPLVGRILAVADAYDAMTTSRPYRNAMSIEKAESVLNSGAGTHWDQTVIDAFFEIRDSVEEIYRDDSQHHTSRRRSVLQHGRFEDLSQGTLADSAQLISCGS